MNGDGNTQLRVRDASTTGSSFDHELAGILRQRTRLLFAIAAGTGVTLFVINHLLVIEPTIAALADYQTPLHLLGVVILFAGLVYVNTGRRSSRQLQGAAFWTMALALMLVVPNLAVFWPDHEPFLPVALMLFVYAAFIPCRTAQTWLAGMAIVAVTLSTLLAPALVPEVADYWSRQGALAYRVQATYTITGTVILAIVSMLVSRNLYALQRTAHRAKRLGNYLIEDELGKGGMGEVYLAQHSLICRPTAVKVLTAKAGEPGALARFEREVQLSASLTHPNTITIFDFGRTSDNTFYYAMEYLSGMDLQSMVDRFGPLQAERVVYLLLQACGSLAEAHDRGIIHRDIKPSNIFVTQRGGLHDFVKVLDFGLAREVEPKEGADLTKTGMVFGTPRYIAPEAVRGTATVDARADLYNLGGVAYWLLTGKPLFAGSSSLDLIIDHVKTVPSPPSELSELPVPPALDAIVMKCLEKEPGDRFQAAQELATALRTVQVGHPWDQDRAREWWTLHAPDRIDLDSKGIPVASDTKGPGVGSEPLETLGEIAPAV
jgi:serine/threonine-protein kinase